MRIDLNNPQREPLGAIEVDPANPPSLVHPTSADKDGIPLHWEGALDSNGLLQRCPACGCRELFARKDFPQRLGLAIVVLGAIGAVVMFAAGYVLWGFAVMGAVVLADLLVSPWVKRCLVCYRCRSEFRGLKIPRSYPAWDLAIGEKYRTTLPSQSGDISHAETRPSPGH